MKSFANFALFALLAIIGGSLATRRIIGPRGPLKLCVTAACRGDLVKADTNAESFGDLTDSFGNSNVESDLYGTRGSVSHGARGAGRFGTAARSTGQITSGNGFGGSSIGSNAAAEAFGTHSSISETRGDAESYNGMGRSGASSHAAGSGFGQSRAKTSAGAGQGFRYKRTVDLEAGTDAKARGRWTETFGDSDVRVSPFGASGNARHGAQAQGDGFTAALSSGGLRATDYFSRNSAGSDANAEGFGTHRSYSETRGETDFFNGLSSAEAGSRAGAAGYGESSSKTGASASEGRFKRQTRYGCRYGNCGGSTTAGTDAEAFGHYTNSFGNSEVSNDNFGSRGRLSHGASGRGVGHSGARSSGKINSNTPYGGSTGSDARADSYGNLGSFADTRGNAQSYNGFGSSGSSATAGSQGFGLASSRTSAGAGGLRRYKRSGDRLCIMGRCYGAVDTQTGGNARGDFTESFGDSSISAQPGCLQALATHESLGRGFGRTGANSQSQINTETQFGFESLGSTGSADAFGDNSLSWTSSKNEMLNGAAITQSQSKGSASGRGRSAARSEATATRQG